MNCAPGNRARILHFSTMGRPKRGERVMTDNKQVTPAKRRPPAAGMGRKKGSVNKTTAAARQMIEATAMGLGGTERMIAWAQSDEQNERAFWTSIFPRLLPLQVTGKDDGPIQTEEVGAGLSKLIAHIDRIAERSGTTGEPE